MDGQHHHPGAMPFHAQQAQGGHAAFLHQQAQQAHQAQRAHFDHGPSPTLPIYRAFTLYPTGEGKYAWENMRVVPKPQESQTSLANQVKKNPYKSSDKEFNNKLSGLKKDKIDRLLGEHNLRDSDVQTEWKIASIDLTQTQVVTGMAKLMTKKYITKHMDVILKKVPRSQPKPKVIRHESISMPFNPAQIHQNQPQYHQQQPQQQQQQQQHPLLHPMAGQHHVNPFAAQQAQQAFAQQQRAAGLFGEQTPLAPPAQHGSLPAQIRLNPVRGVKILDDDDDEDEEDDDDGHLDNGNKKKNKKKDKKGKSKDGKKSPPEIIIPVFREHERRESRNSSRPTSFYDSDAFSPLESPITSLSSSPHGKGHWGDAKRRSSNVKKYHHVRKDGESNRAQRGSFGAHSNDSFVVINKGHSRGKHSGSTSSYRSRSIEDWSRNSSPAHRRRESEMRDERERALLREMERMRVTELERKAEERREQQHHMDMHDRLHRLETIVHDDRDRYEYQQRYPARPSLTERAWTDRPGLGYITSGRREGRHM